MESLIVPNNNDTEFDLESHRSALGGTVSGRTMDDFSQISTVLDRSLSELGLDSQRRKLDNMLRFLESQQRVQENEHRKK